MIELKPEDMTEWTGFDVYDAETGDNLSPSEVAERIFPEDRYYSLMADGFLFTWEGFLYLSLEDGRHVYIPKEEKYLIQFSDGKYMRW